LRLELSPCSNLNLAMQEADDHGVDVVWLEHVTGEEYPEFI
jgi:hypothetical protein